jgi:hypothetical protein
MTDTSPFITFAACYSSFLPLYLFSGLAGLPVMTKKQVVQEGGKPSCRSARCPRLFPLVSKAAEGGAREAPEELPLTYSGGSCTWVTGGDRKTGFFGEFFKKNAYSHFNLSLSSSKESSL